MAVAPTIHDVARAAGVSASTVSRALARPERVSVTTRLRVEQVAGDLGYQPSPQARSLLSGRSMTLALMLPDITNPFFFDLIRGAQRRASEAGYTQVLFDTEESGPIESRRLRLAAKSVDGVVLAASRMSDEDLALTAGRLPVVAINRAVAGVASVVIDTPSGYRSAVAHLHDLGHTQVVYIAGPPSSWSDGRRWRAAREAARRRGMTITRMGPFPPTRAAGSAAADVVLDTPATAVLAFNDLQALGILGRLAERGLPVPGRLSVVGCDDIFGADFCHPPLTTLAAGMEEVGRLATSLLLEMLDRPPGDSLLRRHVRPAVLRIRESTGPPDAAAAVPSIRPEIPRGIRRGAL